MAVRKVGQQWTVEFQYRGIRVFRRLHPSRSKAEAQALESKLRGEIFSARDLDRQPELSLQAAIDRWLNDTLSDKKDKRKPVQNAKLLEPFVAGKTVSQAAEAAREAMKHWLTSSTRGTLGSATVNRRLAVLKAATHYAWKQGWAAENVSGKIPRLREPQGREVYLTHGQVKQLLSHLSEPSRSAVALLTYTGLRASELLSLTKQATKMDSVTVLESKTGKSRTVPLPSPARASLQVWLSRPSDYTYWVLHRQFVDARTKSGLDHVRIHDLRHTCASWLINAGVDLYTVGRILGHSSTQTTARYAHLAHDSLKAAMRKLK